MFLDIPTLFFGYIITKKGGGRFWGSACTGRQGAVCVLEAGVGEGTATFVGRAERVCAWTVGTGSSPHAGSSQYPRQAWAMQPACFLLRANGGAEAGTGGAEAGTGAEEGQGANGSQEAVGHLGAGGEPVFRTERLETGGSQ